MNAPEQPRHRGDNENKTAPEREPAQREAAKSEAAEAHAAEKAADRAAAFAAYAELHDHDPGMLADFDHSYVGGYDRPEDWARQMLTDYLQAASLPTWATEYVQIDARRLVSDLLADGVIHLEPRPRGGVWIFRIE